MPVYLCQPGSGASEPWRHGIQVYAAPFLMDSGNIISTGNDNNTNTSSNPTTFTSAGGAQSSVESSTNNNNSTRDLGGSGTNPNHRSIIAENGGTPIRRIRHAEVVLVDDVCLAFGRHWLRLRWPGRNGGFAGYIALGRINDEKDQSDDQDLLDGQLQSRQQSAEEGNSTSMSLPGVARSLSRSQALAAATAGRAVYDVETRDSGDDNNIARVDSAKDDEPQDNVSTLSAEPLEASSPVTNLVCSRNSLIFPSSVAMKLLTVYDDGFCTPVMPAPLPSEAVFCRICREGLHEDADDEQPTPAVENEADESGGDGGGLSVRRGRSGSPSGSSDDDLDDNDAIGEEAADDEREPLESDPIDPVQSKGPILPHPTYHANPHAAENPMLSPCECSGSMAFVHYMCIEQWRCRSRHPEARQGLSCETCGKPYALPPPSARPANILQVDNEDWLEAMPPHVLEALRRPHIWWQIGAAVVRRRWLRPLAPVVMSPIVALYCRARRMLKKRGVARRRWACSLCRRRARWKCVRCLRSYYCSRQCQNVSWHIVHKHVCYKPSRWIWSLIFYGAVFLLAFPGSLRDPLMYDLAMGAVPVSFYLSAVIGGGFATAMKKGAGVDLRGRTFEVLVVLSTSFLVLILWGLIGGFFGMTSKCYGFLPIFKDNSNGQLSSSFVLQCIQKLIMVPAQDWFHTLDKWAFSAPTKVRRIVCITGQTEGCFEYAYRANASFTLEEPKCASDVMLVTGFVFSAIVIGSASYVWKQRQREHRRRRQGRPHLHQD